MDGSQKLPQRPRATMRERLARGLPISLLPLAVVAWIRYVGVVAGGGSDRLRAVLGVESVFGTDLPRSAPFVSAVTEAYAALLARGARGAAART